MYITKMSQNEKSKGTFVPRTFKVEGTKVPLFYSFFKLFINKLEISNIKHSNVK